MPSLKDFLETTQAEMGKFCKSYKYHMHRAYII